MDYGQHPHDKHIRFRRNRGTFQAVVSIGGREITLSAKSLDEARDDLVPQLLKKKNEADRAAVENDAIATRQRFPKESLAYALQDLCSKDPKWMPDARGRLTGQAQNCERLIKWIGAHRHPSELTEDVIAEFFEEDIYRHMRATRYRAAVLDDDRRFYSRANTVNKYNYALQKLLKHCHKKPRRWIKHLPEFPEQLETKNIPVYALTVSQVIDLINLMERKHGRMCAHVILFCVRTTCRIMEALDLTYQHLEPVTGVEGIGGRVTFDDTKNGESRSVDIATDEWADLYQWAGQGLKGQIKDYANHVFPIAYASFLERYHECIDELVEKWCWTEKRRSYTNVHSLRKTGLTLYANGWEGSVPQMGVYQLQAMGGQKTAAVLQHYVDLANQGNGKIIAASSVKLSNAVHSVSFGRVVGSGREPDQTNETQSPQRVSATT